MKPDTLTIDFETRSETDIKAAGGRRYSACPTTLVLCCAYKKNNEKPKIYIPKKFKAESLTIDTIKKNAPKEAEAEAWLRENQAHIVGYEEFKADMGTHVRKGNTFVAHNAEFEIGIFKHCLPEIKIPLSLWDCTAARAAMSALPRSLEKAAECLKLPIKKDMAGNSVMRSIVAPKKRLNGKAMWHQERWRYVKTFAYCMQDVETQYLMHTRLPNLPATEKNVWRVNVLVNSRGAKIDVETVECLIELLEQKKSSLEEEFQDIVKGKVKSPKAIKAFLHWLAEEQNTKLQDLTKATVSAALRRKNLTEKVRRILKIRQELSRTSTTKLKKMLKTKSIKGDRLEGMFMYHGATTGRWSGRLVQPQNLPREGFKDFNSVIEAVRLKSLDWVEGLYGGISTVAPKLIRNMLIPEKDHVLICSDYSSVEARVLNWLAGGEKVLNSFRKDLDIYKVAAAGIYKKSYNKVTKEERHTGKVAVLALGYGGGKKALQAMSRGYGIEMKDETAQDIVDCWRESNKAVVRYWGVNRQAAEKALANKTKVYRTGAVAWCYAGGSLMCKLPSGRVLYYPYPLIEKVKAPWDKMIDAITFYGKQRHTAVWGRVSTYGGKLVENITQAVARDIMAGALIRLELGGKYKPVLHTHDEIVSEIPKGQADMEEYNELMIKSQSWHKGLPLKAEGWISERYKK